MYEYGIKYCKILVWFSDSSSCAANLPGVRTTLGHSHNFRSKLTKILLLFNKAPIRSTLLLLEQIPPPPLDNDTQYSTHGATPNCSDVSDDNSAECCFSYSCDCGFVAQHQATHCKWRLSHTHQRTYMLHDDVSVTSMIILWVEVENVIFWHAQTRLEAASLMLHAMTSQVYSWFVRLH